MTEQVKAEINSGDMVEIDTPRHIYIGRVISAICYRDFDTQKPDWYIELDTKSFGYVYWKQGIDGGSVFKCLKSHNDHLCEII